MLKKTLLAFLLSCVIIFAVGCNSYSAYKDYYSNVEEYLEIWTLSGFYYGETEMSPLFPSQINELDVEDFFCRYDQQFLLGEGVQLFLKVQYSDKPSFEDEVHRITSLTYSCKNEFNATECEVYALRLGDDLTSEYCFINTITRSVCYVYLKNIPKSEIEIDHKFVPKNYTEYGKVG